MQMYISIIYLYKAILACMLILKINTIQNNTLYLKQEHPVNFQ